MTDPVPPDLVFVYGTLRAAGGHPMARLLAQRASRLGPATLGGILLDVGPYPAAVPSGEDGDRIVGELFLLDPARAAATLRELDAYEGCPDTGSDHDPALYVRAREVVHDAEGTARPAWVWWWNRDPGALPRIESGDWIRHRGG